MHTCPFLLHTSPIPSIPSTPILIHPHPSQKYRYHTSHNKHPQIPSIHFAQKENRPTVCTGPSMHPYTQFQNLNTLFKQPQKDTTKPPTHTQPVKYAPQEMLQVAVEMLFNGYCPSPRIKSLRQKGNRAVTNRTRRTRKLEVLYNVFFRIDTLGRSLSVMSNVGKRVSSGPEEPRVRPIRASSRSSWRICGACGRRCAGYC